MCALSGASFWGLPPSAGTHTRFPPEEWWWCPCLPSLDSGSSWLGPGRDTISHKASLISELGMYFCGLHTCEGMMGLLLGRKQFGGLGDRAVVPPGSGSSVLGDGGRSLALAGSCPPWILSSVCSSADVGLESTRFPAPCWGLGTKTYQKNPHVPDPMNLEKMVLEALLALMP